MSHKNTPNLISKADGSIYVNDFIPFLLQLGPCLINDDSFLLDFALFFLAY